MATETDIRDAVYQALVTIISNNTSVSTPAAHVSELDVEGYGEYPALGFELFTRNDDMGMTRDGYVSDVTYTNGSIDSATIAYPRVGRLEIGVFTRDRRDRSLLHDAVVDHFEDYLEAPSNLHADVDDVEELGTQGAGRAEDGVGGVRQRYDLEYERYSVKDVPAMETAKLTIEDLETGTVLEDGSASS